MSREAFEEWATTKDWYSTARSYEEGRDYSSDLCEYAWRAWQAAQDDAFERAAKVCEAISDEYQRRESMRYPEMKTDAATGASDCEFAIRALVKEAEK